MTTISAGGFTLTRRVGAGGEAEVFEIAERPGLVCKHYRVPTPERAEKLRVMLEHPPAGTRAGGHVSIAWPTELVLNDTGRVTGFLMPRIDVATAVPVFQVYNPATRVRVAPGFTWRYLLRTARNVAAIVDAVHRAGHVVGDLNESNLLVDRRALVALVDCDSMQICDPTTGRKYLSTVGKPEFLAPELHGSDLSSVERTPETDTFALGVLIHQLLAEGVHPHAGVWKGKGDPPDVSARIKKGWTASRRGWSPVDPPPHAVPHSAFPREVRALLRRSLSRRPAQRPEAWEWLAVLDALDGHLRTCKRSAHHQYAGRRCPWCDRIDRGLPDPFPGPSGSSTVARRGPSLRRRISAAIRRSVRSFPSYGRNFLHRTRLVPVVAATAAAGWTFPVVAPALIALALLPATYAVATPTRRLLKAWLASGRMFVTSATASAGVVAPFVDWPTALPVASALAAVVHGIVVPAGSPAWAPARRRLAALPGWLVWAAVGAATAAAVAAGVAGIAGDVARPG